MCFDRVGQKAVLLLSGDAIINDLTICTVLIELCSAFFKRCSAPELCTDVLVLVQNLLLFKKLREHDVEREDRHDDHDDENRP